MTDPSASSVTNNQNTTPSQGNTRPDITIVGAGPAGTLLSIFLSRRGHRVTVLERLPDLRQTKQSEGRSINLALADRGIHALRKAGAYERIEPLLIPMRGRMLHAVDNSQTFNSYGQDREVIYSVSRRQLNAALLDHAEREHGVQFRFRQTCISVDSTDNSICVQDIPSGKLQSLPLQHVIGADGAGSVLRHFLVDSTHSNCTEDMLSHGYKELTIAASESGAHQLEAHALHVWPRGDFMLIALPNLDGTFTATLFLPMEGPTSFFALTEKNALVNFFEKHFPDAYALMPDVASQFAAHPTGSMGTVHCARWSIEDRLLLIGDAAHAIVPFHGQGMNCALEDCATFDNLLQRGAEWNQACATFEIERKPNTDAIAAMALENYVEMRDTVRSAQFQLQKSLSLILEKRFPKRFIPRYSMVMFHHEIPYAVAFERGKIQTEILELLTANARNIDDVDFARAEQLIESRLPLL